MKIAWVITCGCGIMTVLFALMVFVNHGKIGSMEVACRGKGGVLMFIRDRGYVCFRKDVIL